MIIGKRTQIQNIRSVWPAEPDFSRWLATSDGLELIRQDVGVEMDENPVLEISSADFRCDIVGKMIGEEHHVVVIENQYGRSDHDHLGKFLTYAAVHKAMTGIWLVEHASDDHRQVIDWLNANTPDMVNLFLAEIKAFTIGSSEPAPYLEVVCRPNLTQKIAQSRISEAEVERKTWNRLFWQEVHEKISETRQSFALRQPPTTYWSTIKTSIPGVPWEMIISPNLKTIALQLLVSPTGWHLSAYKQLEAQRAEIEAKLGRSLNWVYTPNRKRCRIVLQASIDPGDNANRAKVSGWFATNLPILYKVFQPYVNTLTPPAGDDEPQPGDEDHTERSR